MNDVTNHLEEMLQTGKDIHMITMKTIEVLERGVDLDQRAQLLALSKLINKELK